MTFFSYKKKKRAVWCTLKIEKHFGLTFLEIVGFKTDASNVKAEHMQNIL